jgi:hypothetical protein
MIIIAKPPLFRNISVISLFLLIGGFNNIVFAQQNGGVLLRDGVVIDPKNGEVFYNSPDRQLRAISLKTGALKWEKTDTVKPLAFAYGKLIGQANDTSHIGKFKFLFSEISSKENGKTASMLSVDLPKNANTDNDLLQPNLFLSRSKVINNDVFISWEYKAPLSGRFKGDSASKKERSAQSGAIKIDGKTGTPSLIEKALLPKNFERAIVLSDSERVPNINGQQFISADEKNILTSEKVAGDTTFDNYLWKIYDRHGKKIGELRDYRSYAPFFVSGKTIIYERGQHIQRVGNEINKVPLKIVAVDLSSGKQLWDKEIFDSRYRGSVPPAKRD